MDVDLKVGNCPECLADFPVGSIDVVVTSPPYNLDKDYQEYQDNLTPSGYLDWMQTVLNGLYNALHPDGSIFINLAGSSKQPLLPHLLMSRIAHHSQGGQGEFYLQNVFHWIKSISIKEKGKDRSRGHFKPVNSKRFTHNAHEYVFHLTKTGHVELDRQGVGVEYEDKSNIGRFGADGRADRRCRGNTWFIPYKTIRSADDQRPHPAVFPPELAAMCIGIHAGDNLRVLDPFIGIGNTITGAYQARKAYRDRPDTALEKVESVVGTDLNPGYLEIAKEKIKCTQE